jgi:anthraniloyl-CoA monooxygenase
MEVAIVGGGPAGLYLALLLRARELARSVTVYERNRPEATFGFGIVLSGRTLANLQTADAPSYERIAARCVRWQDVLVGHRGELVRIGGNSFAGIGRLEFLQTLRERCVETGVELRYQCPVDDPDALRGADLVVGADGVRSTVREAYADAFQPLLDERRNRYIWLGTRQGFDGLAMLFRQAPEGLFVAHAYRYGPEGSTFVVECAPETWAAAELDRRSPDDGLRFLAEVFAAELDGAPLVAKDYRWIRFLMLSNRCWRHENVVLLGDALHTAHFSIGSGTKLAVEDAMALAEALARESDPRVAVDQFATARRPGVEAYQAASLESLRWLEGLDADLDLDPVSFAYRCMTRSGRVDADSVRRRDPQFMARVDAVSGR